MYINYVISSVKCVYYDELHLHVCDAGYVVHLDNNASQWEDMYL